MFYDRETALLLLTALALSGCVVGPKPTNLPVAAWQPQQLERAGQQCVEASNAPDLASAVRVAATRFQDAAASVSPGDRIRVRVLGDEQRITGLYVIQPDYTLSLPGISPIGTAGLDEAGLQSTVARTLARAGQIRPLANAVDVRIVESVGASVSIAGAVFEPGTVRVGERKSEERTGQRDGSVSGDTNAGRTLSAVVRSAGGIRPDADLRHVRIIRGPVWSELDLAGNMDGSGEADLQVVDGDRVIVPSTGCFDPHLVRPSSLTMGGIRVYMSNLSRSAGNNASAAVGKDAGSLPYGTRLLQGLVSMNCVGGSAMNAGRRAVLISRNPINGKSVVVERQVERLVRDAGRDDADPYLMPGDAIACYDSRWMNLQDAVALVGGAANVVTPAILLRNASK